MKKIPAYKLNEPYRKKNPTVLQVSDQTRLERNAQLQRLARILDVISKELEQYQQQMMVVLICPFLFSFVTEKDFSSFFFFFWGGAGRGGVDSLCPSQQLWSCWDGQFT